MVRALFRASALAVVVLLAAATWAQLPSNGEVTGTVLDPSGAVVAGAMVSLTEKATSVSHTEKTDTSGNFLFHAVNPGAYDLAVSASGFEKAVVRDVVVLVGKTTDQHVKMSVSGSTESIEVAGAPPVLQESRSEIGQVIERKELDSLPLKTRDFSDLATLVPQVVRTPVIDPTKARVGNISVAGTGGRQSNVYVDGFENYDFVIGGLAYDVSPDAIQEFNVVTTRFTAEQSRSMGALINIVERSGTNNVHGSGFFFFRNQSLSALDYFQTTQSQFHRYESGGTLGGPIKKDRLFIFGAFEDHHELDTGIVNTNGHYPQFDGNFPLPFRRDFVTTKADYVINNSHHFSYRFNLDDFNATENVGGIRAFSNGRHDLTRTSSNAGTETWLISPTKVNTVGFQYFHFNNLLQPIDKPGPQFTRPDLITGERTGDPQGTKEVRYQLRDDLIWSKGKHSIHIGGEFHHVDGSAFIDFATHGQFIFFTDTPLDAPNADLLVQSACNNPTCQMGDLASQILGFYVHDDWKITPNLTLNLGIRYDYFSNENNKNFDGILGLLAPPGSRHSNKKDFSPRVGFAYDPFKNGKFVVRGGYGIYYANINLLDGIVERGFDGRNIGFRVFFNPGNISVTNPFPGLTPQQAHDQFFGPPQDPLGALDNNLRTPYVQYWSGGFQWAFTKGFVLSMDGVHSLGIHGIASRDINVDQNFNVAVPAAPLCQYFGMSVCTQFGGTTWIANQDVTHYNALILAVNKSLSHRVQFNTSYTLSKADNLYNESVGSGGDNFSNPFFPGADKGPAVTDQRHRFIFSSIIDPSHFGPFFGGGWEIALISTYSTPLPYDITAGTQPDGITPFRPAGIGRNNGNRGSDATLLADINAYRSANGLPTIDRTLTPNNLNFRSNDLRLSRTIPLGERFRVRLQGEVFNLFNSANFISNSGHAGFGVSGIVGDANSSSVGLPTSTPGVLGVGGPRAFQLSARVTF
jgi:Carboxypeptidase regulatory-like domain/TonB dependent receptor/TonB-dependent Receptor Plug Domain